MNKEVIVCRVQALRKYHAGSISVLLLGPFIAGWHAIRRDAVESATAVLRSLQGNLRWPQRGPATDASV